MVDVTTCRNGSSGTLNAVDPVPYSIEQPPTRAQRSLPASGKKFVSERFQRAEAGVTEYFFFVSIKCCL
ncbi:hypothetical protein [Kineosporia mesophila]|uniref:hypothetical protein n=1 Tax=Kineosporia mesophila TaxID=566012 RepID=UPI001E33DDB9|nr:hypothetical protein [Kineosporia mesophila]MCD5351373.1 hypothetical protein [Kineosporia mesophila]